MRHASRLSVLLLVSLAALGCRERAPAPGPLRVAFDLWPGYFPAILAAEAGTFDSLGVDVRITIPENTAQMLTAFAADEYDAVAASLADLLPVMDRLPPVRIVACTDESYGADVVMARPGIASASALRGRRVGLKMGGFSELFVRHLFYTAGVAAEEVQLVDLDGSEVVAALRAGEIDAGQTWEPYAMTLAAEGYRTLITSREVPGLIIQCLAIRETVVAQRPTDVQRLVDGWFLQQAALRRDPEPALRRIAARLGRPEQELRIDGVRFLDRAENVRLLAGSDSTVSLARILARQQGFLGSLGLLRAPVDAARITDPRFVQ